MQKDNKDKRYESCMLVSILANIVCVNCIVFLFTLEEQVGAVEILGLFGLSVLAIWISCCGAIISTEDVKRRIFAIISFAPCNLFIFGYIIFSRFFIG